MSLAKHHFDRAVVIGTYNTAVLAEPDGTYATHQYDPATGELVASTGTGPLDAAMAHWERLGGHLDGSEVKYGPLCYVLGEIG
jgi:hypothetical protein